MIAATVSSPKGWPVRAHPIQWELDESNDWGDSQYGFHIEYCDDEEEDQRYVAYWGEGDSDTFDTLEAAKEWCQELIDSWVRRCALIEPSPAAQHPEILQEVLAEVARAAQKSPTWPTDPLHALGVLGEEFGELTRAVMQATYEPHKGEPGDVRSEAVQTAAMALRFLFSLDRYAFAPGAQHIQGPQTDDLGEPNDA